MKKILTAILLLTAANSHSVTGLDKSDIEVPKAAQAANAVKNTDEVLPEISYRGDYENISAILSAEFASKAQAMEWTGKWLEILKQSGMEIAKAKIKSKHLFHPDKLPFVAKIITAKSKRGTLIDSIGRGTLENTQAAADKLAAFRKTAEAKGIKIIYCATSGSPEGIVYKIFYAADPRFTGRVHFTEKESLERVENYYREKRIPFITSEDPQEAGEGRAAISYLVETDKQEEIIFGSIIAETGETEDAIAERTINIQATIK